MNPAARWRWPAGVLVVAAVAVALAFLFHGNPGRTQPRRHEVEISGFVFVPERLEVQPGDTVVWLNRDIVAHTATASSWTTGEIAADSASRVVVAEPGEYRYTCVLHPTMTGLLVVVP
ncbi:MAG TPA: cupredoxin domain-containing protein [Longimicrobiales bacterium]|nr:cupredoxin domain-containing protein [Longimicrobiales bacterium]